MDINSPLGQQIYRSIERGHMVPTATGFRDSDTGWHYDFTSLDYFVRRKPEEGRLERIPYGSRLTMRIDALQANEHLRVGTRATYDELLCPKTLPPNVKKNVRPGGWRAEELLAQCRANNWEVLEHDPAKWPYFEKPLAPGQRNDMLQDVSDMPRDGWPVNRTRQMGSGDEYSARVTRYTDAAPPPYRLYRPRAQALHNANQPAGIVPAPPDAMRPAGPEGAFARRPERMPNRLAQAQAEAEWEAAHPIRSAAVVGLGMAAVMGGACLVGLVVGFAVRKVYNALHR